MNADHGDQWEKERMERIKKVCLELYGITNILDPIVVDKTPTPKAHPSQAISPSIYSKGSIMRKHKGKSPSSNSKRNRNERKEEEEMSVAEKIVHCMRFIQICKNAVLYETQKQYFAEMSGVLPDELLPQIGEEMKFKVETHQLNDMVVIVGRKLSIDLHMIDDIDRTPDDQVPRLAEMRVRTVFEGIVRAQDFNSFFEGKPQSSMDVATVLLSKVFGIENNEATDSYLN